jgi:hypothetical protein
MLDGRRRQLRCRIHAKFELPLFAIVCREVLEEEGTKTESSVAAERVEDKEALEAATVYLQVSEFCP